LPVLTHICQQTKILSDFREGNLQHSTLASAQPIHDKYYSPKLLEVIRHDILTSLTGLYMYRKAPYYHSLAATPIHCGMRHLTCTGRSKKIKGIRRNMPSGKL
jgi:hypothetical protein